MTKEEFLQDVAEDIEYVAMLKDMLTKESREFVLDFIVKNNRYSRDEALEVLSVVESQN